jgi:hypothetical protein
MTLLIGEVIIPLSHGFDLGPFILGCALARSSPSRSPRLIGVSAMNEPWLCDEIRTAVSIPVRSEKGAIISRDIAPSASADASHARCPRRGPRRRFAPCNQAAFLVAPGRATDCRRGATYRYPFFGALAWSGRH